MIQLEDFTAYTSNRYVKNASGLVIERELYTDIMKEVKQVNKRNKERKKKYTSQEHTDRGEKTGWSVEDAIYGMGDPRFASLRQRKFNFDRFTSKEELKSYRDAIKQMNDPKAVRKKDRQLKANYIQALKNTFGADANPIIASVRSTNMGVFMRKYFTENIGDFSFIYSFQSRVVKLIELAKIWGTSESFINKMGNLL